MTETLQEIDINISDPYPVCLDALHERVAPGRLVASPTGHILASPAVLREEAVGPLHRFGLAVADAGPESVFGAGPVADRFAVGLLDLHEDLLRRTVRQAIRHLDGRTSGGATLLSKQLVHGELADIAMALSTEHAMPAYRRATDRQSRWRAHRRLVHTGRMLVRLFGGSGFLADGPAVDLYLAEVTGNVYLHPETEEFDD